MAGNAEGKQVEIDLDDTVIAVRIAARAIDLGVAVDRVGSTLLVDVGLEDTLRRLIELQTSSDDRATHEPVAALRVCTQCSGGMFEGRCQSCYWSPTDISGEGGTPTLRARRLDGQLVRGVSVSHCALAGGSGVPLLIGADLILLFTEDGLDLRSAPAEISLWKIPFEALTGLWVGGSGSVTSDAGMSGGGLGLSGAATGIAAAWLVNRVTRTTTVTTLLNVTFVGGELFFLHSQVGPQTLRMLLSPVYARLGSSDLAIAERDGGFARGGGGIVFVV